MWWLRLVVKRYLIPHSCKCSGRHVKASLGKMLNLISNSVCVCLRLLLAFLVMAYSENICLQRIYDLINDQNMPAVPRPVQTVFPVWASAAIWPHYTRDATIIYTASIALDNTSHCIHIVCSCVRAGMPAVLPFSPRHRYVRLCVFCCLTLWLMPLSVCSDVTLVLSS